MMEELSDEDLMRNLESLASSCTGTRKADEKRLDRKSTTQALDLKSILNVVKECGGGNVTITGSNDETICIDLTQ